MTIPQERTAAIIAGNDLLSELLRRNIPRTELKARIRAVLRHYPWPHHINELARAAPEILSEWHPPEKKN